VSQKKEFRVISDQYGHSFHLTGATTKELPGFLSATITGKDLTGAGPTSVEIRDKHLFTENKVGRLPFDVKRDATASPLISVQAPIEVEEPENAQVWKGSGPMLPQSSIAVADAISLTDTSTSTFTRTDQRTKGGALGAELSVGDTKETGVAGKMQESYQFSKTEAETMAMSLARASGVMTTETRMIGTGSSPLLPAKPHVIRFVPIARLATMRTSFFDAGADGVIPRGNPTRIVYTHSRLVVGVVPYQGKDDEDVERKVLGKDRSPAYPPDDKKP
jgi:hypothetical protein